MSVAEMIVAGIYELHVNRFIAHVPLWKYGCFPKNQTRAGRKRTGRVRKCAPLAELTSIAVFSHLRQGDLEVSGREPLDTPHGVAGAQSATIEDMVADATLTLRLSSETKALVREAAVREGLSESALVKRLINLMLQSAGVIQSTPPLASEHALRSRRLSLRLSIDDCRLLKERALARAIPPATYVTHLVATHLRNAAPLPKREYLALRQSILELTAVGRNLNQIARALNQGERVSAPGKAEVMAMAKIAASLRDHFRGLLKVNAASWGNANGEH
jgi:predicted DNA binding CopG/RHH family protein